MSTYSLKIEKTAQKDIKKLPITAQARIAKKLKFYLKQKDPLFYATPLVGKNIVGQYRFRVGEYRVVFDVEKDNIILLSVEHRREVYRR